MTFAPINLANLPAPAVVQTWGFDAIVTARLADFTARMAAAGIAYDSGALESEPAVKLQETGAYREGLVAQRINEAALATMLAYAQGPDLDQVAAAFQTVRAPGELDPSLRARAQLAWEALSLGGSYGGYRYQALSADPVGLADVAVYGGEVPGVAAGEVCLVCLGATATGVPAPATLEAVAAAFPRASRKVNDRITVRTVQPIPWSADATLVLAEGADPDAVVASQGAALAAFALARRAIGGAVSPSAVSAVLAYNAAGLVWDVELRTPAATIGGGPFDAPIFTGARIVWRRRTTP